MTSIPPEIAGQMALTRQNVAMSILKQSSDAQKMLADVIEQTAESQKAAASGGRGRIVDLFA